METRIRKPRVFLSHSKQNIAFINRINVDLMRCQIEPWQDTVEIRHGKPWLNAIFQEGIPSCDAVLVYLTESSIESPMVKKEIDAGIISQLGENGIAFLPYIEQGILREKLRPDIKALQILEWNASNYNELLPSVVAEIWRSYSERMVSTAVQQEKLRRLELELALEKLQKDDNGAIFASSEDRDFTYIWNSLNRNTQIIFEASIDDPNDPSSPQKAKAKRVEAEIKATMNVASLVISLIDRKWTEYEPRIISHVLLNSFKSELDCRIGALRQDRVWKLKKFPDIETELLMYGLVQRVIVQQERFGSLKMTNKIVISDKIYRFRYWLAIKEMLQDGLSLEWEQSSKGYAERDTCQ